ncbi:uncharacterized protein FIBRA_02832 [Fibroporia radiculosa]|uniref:Transglutaminase-like domain-containing protein n=1 Tax=Fibroporia radiculosa TaxID=599839 RepID=J4GN53_9APHY|nr:uncharacterized protein FIBRA_02832 [Fibroporia radiculosa]CCM00790.1 predicted protein [Fibroporia radiculosa]
MALAPPLPRRKVPPPPPPRRPSSTASTTSSDSDPISIDTPPPVQGIAARIAALNLENKYAGVARDADSVKEFRVQPAGNGLGARMSITSATVPSDTLVNALKRPPPPPPRASKSEASPLMRVQPPPPPPRKAPPLPARRSNSQASVAQDTTKVEEPQPSPPPAPARRLPPPFRSREPATDKAESTPKPPTINRATRPPSVPVSLRSTAQVSVPEPVYAPEPMLTASDSDDSCLKCRSFEEVDAHAACFPRENVDSLQQLAYDLTAPFDSLTDKARAIFTWLHHNIAYDAYSFLNNCMQPSTPTGTLQSGLAVCEGYAKLFANLAEYAGMQALTVNGHGKGFGYVATEGGTAPPFASNHAWNAVVFDDEQWHLIDACWGAGVLSGTSYTKRFAPIWFTSTNEQFGRRHFPAEAGHQMREDGREMSWEEYILEPEGPEKFSHFEECEYAQETLLPAERCLAGGYAHTFHVEKRCWHIERRDYWSDYVLLLMIECGGVKEKEVMERDERGWTATVHIPRVEGSVNMAVLTSWNGQDARGVDPALVRREWGRRAMAFQGIVHWEVR